MLSSLGFQVEIIIYQIAAFGEALTSGPKGRDRDPEFLRAGGSASPWVWLRDLAVDVEKHDACTSAFKHFEPGLTQLEGQRAGLK